MTKIMENNLNMVTGGDMLETLADSNALYQMGLMIESYTIFSLIFDWERFSKRVDRCWSTAGITSISRPFKRNTYLKNGSEISRDQALQVIGI